MTETQPQEHAHIMLAGRIWRLCPDFDDLSQIEKKLSTSILALAKKMSDGLISLEELAVMLEHCIESEARNFDLKFHILESGIAHVTHSLTALFVHLFRGKEEHAVPAYTIPEPASSPEALPK